MVAKTKENQGLEVRLINQTVSEESKASGNQPIQASDPQSLFYIEYNGNLNQLKPKEPESNERIKISLPDYQYSWSIFFEMLIYHLIYFFLFGPVICVFLWFKNKHLVFYNLGLFDKVGLGPSFSIFALIISILWPLSIANNYWNSFDGEGWFIIYVLVSLFLFIMCIIPASKYLYSSRTFIKLMKTKKLTFLDIEIGNDPVSVFNGFTATQPKLGVVKEVQENIIDLNIDISLFYFDFLGYVPSKLSEIMTKKMPRIKEFKFVDLNTKTICIMNGYLAKVYDWFSQRYFSKPTRYDQTKLYGYNLALDLISEVKSRSKLQRLIVSLVPFISAPALYRFLVADAFESPIVAIFLAFSIVTILILPNIILFSSVENLQARVWLMKEIGKLLSEEQGIYPKFNIFDPMTLRTWSNLRKILMNHGHALMARISFLVTLTTTFFCVIIVLFIADKLGLITFMSLLFGSIDPALMNLLVIEGVIEGTLFLVIVLAIFWYGNALNKQYILHRNLIKANKIKAEDLVRFAPNFLGPEAIEPADEMVKEGFRLMKEEFGEENLIENIQKKAILLNRTFDDMIEDLNVEEFKNPFKVMGIRVSNNVIKSLYVGLFSLSVAIIQKIVNAHS